LRAGDLQAERSNEINAVHDETSIDTMDISSRTPDDPAAKLARPKANHGEKWRVAPIRATR
jgi:hypothetical protein